MKESIRRFIKETPNSVLFWNASYYIILIAAAIFDIDLAIFLYGISSIIAFGILHHRIEEKHLWIATSIPVLLVVILVAVGFGIGYLIYRVFLWDEDDEINKKSNGEV